MFKKEFKKSVRFKFLGVISGILFVSTVVLSSVIAINEREMLRHSLMTKGQSFASYIAKLSQDPLIMKDSIQLDLFVNEANKDEDILYTIIQDAKGNLVTSEFASINYATPRLQAILSGLSKDRELPDIIAVVKKKEAIVELAVPILSGSNTIGKVTICMSQHNIRRQIVKTILFVLALNVIVAFVLGAVLFVASKKIILTPIAELAGAAARLAKGDLSTQVAVKATGELQMLVDSFNRMAEDLEKTTVSKNYVDDIINSMNDTLIVTTSTGTILRMNKAAALLLGYDETELIGQPIGRVVFDESGTESVTVDSISNEKYIGTSEKTYLAKNGKMVPVLFSSSVLHGVNDAASGLVCAAQDITYRKRYEDTLKTFSEELKESNDDLKAFVYSAAHDLRGPLVNLKGFSAELAASLGEAGALLARGAHPLSEHDRQKLSHMLGSDILESVVYIETAVKRMDVLINAMLKLSRAGNRELKLEYVETDKTVQGVLDSLNHQISENGISVRLGHLPPVNADEAALEQIFSNMIENAMKYVVPGRPACIEIEGVWTEEGVLFRVRDNGRGIARDDLPKLFKMFRRIGAQDVPGDGVGLAYAKTLVRRHGGRIWCESEPGRGSIFSFTVPQRRWEDKNRNSKCAEQCGDNHERT